MSTYGSWRKKKVKQAKKANELPYWKSFKPAKIKPMKVHFSLDSDRDGVDDRKDCRPFNPKRQDWDIEGAKKRGYRIEYMEPDDYIRKTGLIREDNPDYFDRYFEDYYDIEEGKRKPIKELGKIIKDPEIKVQIPWVDEKELFSVPHEGRHRAFVAKMIGQKKIPVARPSLVEYSMEEREKIGKIFVKEAGLDRDPAYASEWIDRFKKGRPEAYMDSKNIKLFVEILEEFK